MTRSVEMGKRGAVALFILGFIFVSSRTLGTASPWFSVTTAFLFLGLMDLLRPLIVVRVPPALFPIRDWERSGTLYRRLGIISFGQLLRRSPLRYLNRRVYLAAKAGDRYQLRKELSAAEAGHFWATAMTLPYIVIAFARGWWSSLVALGLFHVAVNLCPILHLRWARSRLDRVLQPSRLRR